MRKDPTSPEIFLIDSAREHPSAIARSSTDSVNLETWKWSVNFWLTGEIFQYLTRMYIRFQSVKALFHSEQSKATEVTSAIQPVLQLFLQPE